jgi:hypothetical protein
MYSLREFLRALAAAPLVTIPTAVCVALVAHVLSHDRASSVFEAFGGGLGICVIALPTAYIATLLVSAPAVLVANARFKRVSRCQAVTLGAVTGLLAGGAWAQWVATGSSWSEPLPHIIIAIAVFSGAFTGLCFEHLLP